MEEEWRWCSGEFPRGGKILVFIRLVPVLVTFDKNACYAFQTRPGPGPGPERPSRESYANRSREFSLVPFSPVLACKRVAANLHPYKYLYAMISRIQWQIFFFFFTRGKSSSFPFHLLRYSLHFDYIEIICHLVNYISRVFKKLVYWFIKIFLHNLFSYVD